MKTKRTISNLSSVRNAARLACAQQDVSIKDANVNVSIMGFCGEINDEPYENELLWNEGVHWLHGDNERVIFIRGTYTHVIVRII